MPDAALISALEELRESYGQRQRLTANLLKALKDTAGALGKAGRTLRDYAERNPGGGEGVARASEALAASRLRDEAIDPLLPGLRREEKLLTAQASALKDAAAALAGEAVDVIKLGHALAERGVELGGRPPEFEIGPFELVTDFVSRAATLSYGKTIVARRVPLSVEAVIRAYEREAKAITGRSEDVARWTADLHTAWETVRRRRGTDNRANIVECYVEMVLLRQPKGFRSEPSKHLFKDYTRAQFAYDFFQFTDKKYVIHQGLRAFGTGATKSHTESPDRVIWIVEGASPHAGRYIADVKFEKSEERYAP